MNEELKNRFFNKKLDDLLNLNIKPFPTLIMEEEDPRFLELIRPFILLSPFMIPFKSRCCQKPTIECIENKKIKDYGCLYVLVIPN